MSKRILIVDDEPNIVLSLEFLIRREGYEVAVAADGEAALQEMAGKTPDLVVLDVMLPKMNGFEVCRRIRADPRWQATKVIMLTARGRDTEVAKGIGVGADAYVTKPFSTRDLVAEINGLLRGAQ
jgi:two-component system, OmpR family, alkaline phosphatase synthesis response regulator PhoP